MHVLGKSYYPKWIIWSCNRVFKIYGDIWTEIQARMLGTLSNIPAIFTFLQGTWLFWEIWNTRVQTPTNHWPSWCQTHWTISRSSKSEYVLGRIQVPIVEEESAIWIKKGKIWLWSEDGRVLTSLVSGKENEET